MDVEDVRISVTNKLSQMGNLHRCPDDGGGGIDINDSTGISGWRNSSRIFRVSRATGGKDRHSKVLTSKGLKDRRVRLSVPTAIQFYDLQDRLGYDQPSKAVDWLIKAAAESIAELPSLDTTQFMNMNEGERIVDVHGNDLNCQQCSSDTSETSKCSGLSLSRSEFGVKNGDKRARKKAAKEKMKKETDNLISTKSASFTQLLTGGVIRNTSNSAEETAMDCYTAATKGPIGETPIEMSAIPHFSLSGYHNHGVHQHFSFMPESTSTNESDYDLNFTMASSSDLVAGFDNSRGTLQSNSLFQRFSTMDDGSNLPFLTGTPVSSSSLENHQNHHFSNGFDAGLQLYHGHSDQKRKVNH